MNNSQQQQQQKQQQQEKSRNAKSEFVAVVDVDAGSAAAAAVAVQRSRIPAAQRQQSLTPISGQSCSRSLNNPELKAAGRKCCRWRNECQQEML